MAASFEGAERLTALDHAFLDWESPSAHMHVASVMVFDARPLETEGGGIDIQAIRKATAAALHRIPRYRQRLARIPVEGRAVWVDDDRFSLEYHVRHVALPAPGSDAQLKELAAWIMQRPLDRSRPLWEMWVVEGLAGQRFALVSKVHHCMVDGIAGVDLMKVLLSAEPESERPPGPPFRPRPAPSGLGLLAGEAARRLRLPLEAARDLGAAARELRDLRQGAASRVLGLARTLRRALRPASATPLNGPIGPQRRFEGFATELADVKAVSRALGGTLNDAVLTTVTGAVRRYLRRHGVEPSRVDFRVMAPVSVRSPEEEGTLGNRISLWIVALPVSEPAPRRQLEAIREQTAELKETRQALGAELLTQVADWSSSTLLSAATRAATSLRPFNMVVTNVPGPQLPLYLLRSRLLEAYPVVPLLDGYGLGVALLSYDGRIYWGLNADYDRGADVGDFAEDLRTSFAALRDLAAAPVAERRRRAARGGGAPRAGERGASAPRAGGPG